MANSAGLITLLTDFGLADSYVAEVKGVLLSRAPAATLVDITHQVAPGDVRAGQYLLSRAWRQFPKGTVHLGIVDPGVGTSRRALAASADEHLFVAPDNGLLSFLPEPHFVSLKVPSEAAPTFHGRDVFAPVAAALSTGVAPEQFGAEIDDEVRLPSLETPLRIIHIDRFGNCVTNISRERFEGKSLSINGRTISAVRNFYGEASADELFAIWGSAGFLEISVNGGSAAQILGAKRGDTVSFT